MGRINNIIECLNKDIYDYFKYKLAVILNLDAECFLFIEENRNTEVVITEDQWKEIRDLDILFENISKEIQTIRYFSLINFVCDYFIVLKSDEQ